MLLNELQKQRALNLAQSERLSEQERLLAEQASHLAGLGTLRRELAEVREVLAALQAQGGPAQ